MSSPTKNKTLPVTPWRAIDVSWSSSAAEPRPYRKGMDGFVETATRDRRIDFDLQIVATMKANRVGHIYTFNTSDFENFEELTVIEPSEASSRPVY